MEVTFSVSVFSRHLSVAPEQAAAKVWLLGNTIELGAWDHTKAVPMELLLAKKDETKWQVSVEFSTTASYAPLEYKYIIKESETGEVLSWETLPGSRTTTLTSTTNLAYLKPSTQSSTHISTSSPCPGSRPASYGNNGNRDAFCEWRTCRTQRQSYPWWQVDLEQTCTLTHLNLWMNQTYHEAFKREKTQPPASLVRLADRNSIMTPPHLWLFISSTPFASNNLIQQVKDGALDASSTIHAVDLGSIHDEQRIVGHALDNIQGRYVRMQYDSVVPVTLQFAELEVFGYEGETIPTPTLQVLEDRYYGVHSALDGDLKEFIDREWVDPTQSLSQVRLWIGSFQKDVPAIEWMDEERRGQGTNVQLEYSVRDRTAFSPEWHKKPVDSRAAALLDKESNKLRHQLSLLQESDTIKLDMYRNSVLTSNTTAIPALDAWIEWLRSTKLVADPSKLEDLKTRVVTATLANGTPLLAYGQYERTAFFIVEGQVRVVGPPSTSVVEIGVLKAGTLFNDLALLSHWPKRAAGFYASSDTVVASLTYSDMKSVLGDTAIRNLRRFILREQNTVAKKAAVASQEPLVVDPDHAQVLRFKVPQSVLSSSSLDHRILLRFYDPSTKTLLGTSVLLLAQLGAHGEGQLKLPILECGTGGVADYPPQVIGLVSFHYVVIHPFVHKNNTLAFTWRSQWRERPPQSGGHRGMGRTFNQALGYRKALTRENTLASFHLAHRQGAAFVEFDVQLTKDLVPVIYHDFVLCVEMEDKHAWKYGVRAEAQEVGIHDLTFRQLTNCTTSVTRPQPVNKWKRLVKKHWHTLVPSKQQPLRMRQVLDHPLLMENEDEHLVASYSTLAALLEQTPSELSLNVEIKYPDPIRRLAYRSSASFALNQYVDTILQCVFDHAGSRRRLFFSCFDPALVVLLQAKQVKYPVFFLTYGQVQPPVLDPRLTLQFAIELVKMEHLRGIVSSSDSFLTNPACVELVKREGITLMTWGDQNTGHESVLLQKRYGIDGVISDNMGDLTRQDKKVNVVHH